ncbi:MAG: FadR family transcriptional regulator [Actinobacteria bacterium]|nr:FadR family transcriptional regulator [Actinomycetota bacterium]
MTEFPFDRLTPTKLSEQVASRIESFILGNRLRQGEKLPPERELATRFGVSRAVVRESIKLLEERGLLEPRSGRGAFVTTPGFGPMTSSLNVAYHMQDCTANDLYEARWCLESFIVGLATQRATETDVAKMEAAIAVMDRNLDHPDEFVRADVEFHAALAAATHNPLFAVMSQPLVQMILTMGHLGFSYGRVLERHQNHQRLLDCIRNRDVDGAEAIIHHHLDLSRYAFAEPARSPAP